MQRFTKNLGSTNKIYTDGNKRQNVEAACQALGGLNSTEGTATWAAAKTLTVSDDRVDANSHIILGTPKDYEPVGMWYISSQSSGSFTITSGETEQAGCVVRYLVINK